MWVCGSSFAKILGLNPAGGMAVSLVSVVCYQVEVYVWADHSSRGSFQVGVRSFDREASKVEAKKLKICQRSTGKKRKINFLPLRHMYLKEQIFVIYGIKRMVGGSRRTTPLIFKFNTRWR